MSITFELFYACAPEDERLRQKLHRHLSTLVRQNLITCWHEQDVLAGNSLEQERHAHLHTASIILLLVSAHFLASDDCYKVVLPTALKRTRMGEARIIPVLLRPCDWQDTPFGKLAVLPENRKPVTMWTNEDAAFDTITKGIRNVVSELHQRKEQQPPAIMPESTTNERGELARTPTSIGSSALKSAVKRYNDELKQYQVVADYELGLRSAFQNMLADIAKHVGWSLAPEQTIGKIRPDGVLLDSFRIRRGYWEAKGPDANLEGEIEKKIKAGYPLINTIFEDTRKAVLFQGKRRVPVTYDLRNNNDVADLLQQFFTYVEPDVENFEEAVDEFKERIPEHAQALLNIIKDEHKQNARFKTAFNNFAEVCRASLDPRLTTEAIDEMLVQHLLTERLFRTVFNNPDFVNNNVIAVEIEKVVRALISRSFNRNVFLEPLERFYVAIEKAAKTIQSWGERQEFLNTVYERFFQGFSIKKADTHGIVYTPQEIVDFMVESVDEVLQREYGKSIATPGVKILDPATGTGNFIVNIIRRIQSRGALRKKYTEDLFCNEIMLLPYYIASLNIEHEYYEKMNEYEPFEGICFADTLELAESQQLSLFSEENTERVKREKDADIMVVIGNPPYNVGQKNENDNNKNRKYPLVNQRIKETYAKDSQASNKNALSDAYVKFFRWATDRLQGRDGIVCFVSNNSFIDQITFDGMRKHLLKDFTHIYHLDLHGNVRKNPKLSGTTHNVFGIQVGVGITLAIRNSKNTQPVLKYYRVPEFWRRSEKLNFLQKRKGIEGIDWLKLVPDTRNTWITEGLQTDFSSFLPLGTKSSKESSVESTDAIFRTYSNGVKTNRDTWTYDFNCDSLTEKIKRFIDTYNSDVDRWQRRGNSKTSVDDFVTYDDARIKWSESLKHNLQRSRHTKFDETQIRQSLYRPYCKQWLYFDRVLNERVYQLPKIFPSPESETENIVICLSGIGSSKPFHCLASNIIPCLDMLEKTQCFPYYTYAEDGSNRRENITDWSLKQFQQQYGPATTKWDIFHYTYGMLHHPQYRELYRENLKRDLPHIPLLLNQQAFTTCARIGKQLMDLHITYEQADEYPLQEHDNGSLPFAQLYRVEKMKLTPDRSTLIVNKGLTLDGIPPHCFDYRLGNRAALEWIIDQYQVSTDKRSGLESDPNRLDDPEYIVRLIKQVITISIKTVELIHELAEAITPADWLGGTGATTTR